MYKCHSLLLKDIVTQMFACLSWSSDPACNWIAEIINLHFKNITLPERGICKKNITLMNVFINPFQTQVSASAPLGLQYDTTKLTR